MPPASLRGLVRPEPSRYDHRMREDDQLKNRAARVETHGEPAPTPMMAQYLEIKSANPDCLLFYRMGDFFELFFEDAETASQVLGITLTKRGKHFGQDIAMCGVPVHAADGYLQRLIQRGYRVAVCEQIEDPAEAKKRGSKAVVQRKVVRLVTPGTLTEDSLLDSGRNNFLTALHARPGDGGERYSLASLDLSTGEFLVAQVSGPELAGALAEIAPTEVLIGETLAGSAETRSIVQSLPAALVPAPQAHFDSIGGERRLKELLGVADLGAFGQFAREELAAIGALLTYVSLTQVGSMPILRPPVRTADQRRLFIDAATRASLELVRSNAGGRAGTLLAAIDRTVTAAGARELGLRLSGPLADAKAIRERHDAVGYFEQDFDLRAALRRRLRAIPDIARALARVGLGRGGPRDLGAICAGLDAARETAGLFGRGDAVGLPGEVAGIRAKLTADASQLHAGLAAALADELPIAKRDGGFIRAGHNGDLDAQRALRDDSRAVIANLQAVYAERSGVRSLKIRHNNVLGYFVEVTAAQEPALSARNADAFFRRRQTLAGVMRFSTMELAALEAEITNAGDRARAIELEIFSALEAMAITAKDALQAAAAGLAELDVATALAELAEEQNYVRPEIGDGLEFLIEGGRHPVVEQARAREGAFVDNDCRLGIEDGPDSARLLVVTGPNMGGKSTYLRQNALIVILAQMGSFVPARRADIGVVDRLFSRVGAADDLAAGRSTFMVEMVETAAILNQATERSFVILDEIGRGTATYDGLAIAWATLEHLHDATRCRALFATHYHELTEVAQQLACAGNATVEVKEWRDDIVFLYRVVKGAADRSYGLHVAKLAGLPAPVLARAREVLARLETKGNGRFSEGGARDLPLFAPRRSPEAPTRSPLEEAIETLLPDAMSPREALDALYRLKAMMRPRGGTA